MTTISIPAWTPDGLLPPVNSPDPASAMRSPYRVALTDLILRFGTSEPRREILRGFLDFRALLRSFGIVHGWQWINGSFLENVETLENRNPGDIDVVTFFMLPPGYSQATLLQACPWMADPGAVKSRYKVDSYFVTLNTYPDTLVQQTTYWYSMWSHRRNQVWKGYLRVGLEAGADDAAAAMLAPSTAPAAAQVTTSAQGGTP